MIIAADHSQNKFAVVKCHGEILGIYTFQHQAVRHARSVGKGLRRQHTSCQWIPAADLRTQLTEQRKATTGSHSVYVKSRDVIDAWLSEGIPTHCMLTECGRTVTKVA